MGSHSWVLVIALPISLPAAWLTMPADIAHIPLSRCLACSMWRCLAMDRFFAWNAGMAMAASRGCRRCSAAALRHLRAGGFFNDETITPQIILFAAAVAQRLRSRRVRAAASVRALEADVSPRRHSAGNTDLSGARRS